MSEIVAWRYFLKSAILKNVTEVKMKTPVLESYLDLRPLLLLSLYLMLTLKAKLKITIKN